MDGLNDADGGDKAAGTERPSVASRYNKCATIAAATAGHAPIPNRSTAGASTPVTSAARYAACARPDSPAASITTDHA
ncbi:MAG: hypothetical protein L0K86_27330 [Actinomycetia bacterium]|nr:hypothetical protein [Actinomycetes bacterium]